MPPLFHNPYHFVPVSPGTPPETVPLEDFTKPHEQRQAPHLTHDRFVPDTHSGRVVCRLTVETPLICGNKQLTNDDGERRGWTELIQPFELRSGEPALPGSALRGMLSALAEAATNSALRVLKPEVLSFRRLTSDPRRLSALGIIERGANDELRIRPLAMPTLERRDGAYQFFVAPPDGEYVGEEQRFPGVFPEPSFKVYLGQHPYEASQYDDTNSRPLQNVSAAKASLGPFYGMRLQGPPPNWAATSNDSVAAGQPWQKYPTQRDRQGQRVANPAFLIGRLAQSPAAIAPWQPGMEQQGYTRGIFRGLGLWTPNRAKACPPSKYHELFIPFTPAMEQWRTLPIMPCAIERFNELSRQCNEDDPQHLLPFEPIGTRQNRNGAPLDLRPGDVVYFLPNKGGTAVEEVSFSSMWRGRVEERDDRTGEAVSTDIHYFFSTISPELVPLAPGRRFLTLAEQIFGAVELRDTPQQDALKGKPAFAFATRLRVSHGRLHFSPPEGAYQPARELWTTEQQRAASGAVIDVPLKNLASPKPPSPALYFKQVNGQGAFISKQALNPKHHTPQGRKFYLRRKDTAVVRGNQVFVHPSRFNDLDERDDISRQHQSVEKLVRPGSVFYFHLDFDNLSALEVQLLAYVLQPTPTFRHQLGHGKPLGLGQVRIELVGLLEVERSARYLGELTDHRYHAAHVSGAPESEWPDSLKLGLPPVNRRRSLPSQLAGLIKNFRIWASAKHLAFTLEALERLGDPASVQHPVHYPQAARKTGRAGRLGDPIDASTAAFEKELYQWFVQNEKQRDPGQYLAPLVDNQDRVAAAIPTLDREQSDLPPPTAYVKPKKDGSAGPSEPKELHDRQVEDCVVVAHDRPKNKLQIRFRVPCGCYQVTGLLENAAFIPNAVKLYFVGWKGPMRAFDPKPAPHGWQCTLRPIKQST